MSQEILERVRAAEALADQRLAEAKAEADEILRSARAKAVVIAKDVLAEHLKVQMEEMDSAEKEADDFSKPILEAAFRQSSAVHHELQERIEPAARWVVERIVR